MPKSLVTCIALLICYFHGDSVAMSYGQENPLPSSPEENSIRQSRLAAIPKYVSLRRKPIECRRRREKRPEPPLPSQWPQQPTLSDIDLLKVSILYGNAKTVFQIIERNKKIGVETDRRGHSMVQLAVVFKTHWPLLQMLQNLKRRDVAQIINRRDSDGESPLTFALRENKFLALRTLLEYGANREIQIDGMSPFAYAIQKKKYPIAALLAMYGATIENVRSYRKREFYFQLSFLAVKDFTLADNIVMRLYREQWDGSEDIDFTFHDGESTSHRSVADEDDHFEVCAPTS